VKNEKKTQARKYSKNNSLSYKITVYVITELFILSLPPEKDSGHAHENTVSK